MVDKAGQILWYRVMSPVVYSPSPCEKDLWIIIEAAGYQLNVDKKVRKRYVRGHAEYYTACDYRRSL